MILMDEINKTQEAKKRCNDKIIQHLKAKKDAKKKANGLRVLDTIRKMKAAGKYQ